MFIYMKSSHEADVDITCFRAEQILRALQHKMPILADAERSMGRELDLMNQKLVSFKTSLEQVSYVHDKLYV